MKKNIILLGALLLSSLVYSQVGINNSDPKATLDVTAKTTDGTKPEGIIAPRLAGSEIRLGDAQYLAVQTGTIVYATSASPDAGTAGKKTINIDGAGYYYFDGAIWQKFNSGTAPAGTDDWHVTGNAGTTSGTNFIGTTDAKDLMFKVNNTKSGLIGASVGTTAGADWETSFGNSAGLANTTGDDNTFIGAIAGTANTTGRANTVVGSRGLANNVTGEANVAIGAYTLYNTNGVGSQASSNMAVGTNALFSNTIGSFNSGIGDGALKNNTTGSGNVGIGQKSFEQNATGNYNTGIGMRTLLGATNLNNATAIGSYAEVDQSNSIVLGSINGTNAATADTFVGIGTTTLSNKLHVKATTGVAPVRFEGLQTGAATDEIVTTDATGVLRKVTAANLGLTSVSHFIGYINFTAVGQPVPLTVSGEHLNVNTEILDTNNEFDSANNTFTPTSSGTYLIEPHINIDPLDLNPSHQGHVFGFKQQGSLEYVVATGTALHFAHLRQFVPLIAGTTYEFAFSVDSANTGAHVFVGNVLALSSGIGSSFEITKIK